MTSSIDLHDYRLSSEEGHHMIVSVACRMLAVIFPNGRVALRETTRVSWEVQALCQRKPFNSTCTESILDDQDSLPVQWMSSVHLYPWC